MRNRTKSIWRWFVAGTMLLSVTSWASADGPEGVTMRPGLLTRLEASKPLSFTKPSLDSVIAWNDQYFFHQWRIQAHVDSQQCRLLDGDDKVFAQGTFAECLAKLESIKVERDLPPMRGKAVVLLHGLAAPRWSMHLLARYLETVGEYETFTIDYASLRSNIDDQASSLANVIRSLEGIEEINFVGHSMGNIVVRRYMAGNDSPPHIWKADPRIARIVMIAPPNHGSITATRLSNTKVFNTVFGKAGRQLGVDWNDLEKRLTTPQVEFGIIAGGCNNHIGLNPFLLGDDDGRITVATTRLAGATDFLVVPALHELIANDRDVFEYTLRFLDNGYFVARDQRQPIAAGALARRPQSETRR